MRPTRFTRWVRKLLERLLRQFHEGPEPPQRLMALCVAFANEHPKANRADWTRFAAAQCAESWMAGYMRGYESSERDPLDQPWRSPPTPEQVATQLDPDWQWRPGLALNGNVQYIPQDPDVPLDLGLLVEDLIERTMIR